LLQGKLSPVAALEGSPEKRHIFALQKLLMEKTDDTIKAFAPYGRGEDAIGVQLDRLSSQVSREVLIISCHAVLDER
jgi:hypothetical protein